MDTLTKFKTAQYYYELDKTVLTVMSDYKYQLHRRTWGVHEQISDPTMKWRWLTFFFLKDISRITEDIDHWQKYSFSFRFRKKVWGALNVH